ncbi:MAG TPA: ATP-binding cassette domain-containing protein [Candidatus Bathyarchaeota archaeon]|nr:ATP-binding cassette domain-containing protein [Candidatus Bathyarchaeota archaeon]
MAVIEARGLTYTYPESKKPALVDVDLVVEEGEFVILTGPSGCGKTTLCRCLNGLIPHFYGGELEGELYVAGMNVKEHKTWELAQHVGLVFQNPENQLFSLTVEKDVAFGPENLGLPREEIRNRVDWALDRTGTTPLRYRAPYELSGGQQQRVAIASTLAMKPKVLVLDEPTSFLDPRGAQRIFETVNRLNKELGITIILVEHRLDLASVYADRVIVMNDGRIALDGTPKEVYLSGETEALGVGVVKVVKLYQLLEETGLRLRDVPISPKEASKLLREVLSP